MAAVAGLLRETAEAHHVAYRETNGFDPEWPLWYAGHLIEPLRVLGLQLTKSVVVFVLVGAEHDHPDAGAVWPEAYARRLIAEAR